MVAELAAAADRSLPRAVIESAIDAAAPAGQAISRLAAALAADPGALASGAPPLAGRLAAELIARGSALDHAGLRRGAAGPGGRFTARRAGACASRAPPGSTRPPARTAARSSLSPATTPRGSGSANGAAAMTGDTAGAGHAARPPRSRCAPAAARRTSASTATRCPSRSAACAAGTGNATSPPPAIRSARRARRGPPQSAPAAARTGPPQARWPEGPVCDTCYTAALRRRIPCASCGQVRRPVSPPGPDADTCASCAGLPVSSVCGDCGTEDKMFEKHRCARCSLRRRAAMLLSAGTGDVPAVLTALLEAISAARTPAAALNWLRTGGGAGILADLAAGRLAATHEALDQHPHPRAASHLRHMLVAGGVLPPRDEELARTERWLTALLTSVDDPGHRRLVQAFATWHVMRRLRRSAAAGSGPGHTPPEPGTRSRQQPGSSAGSARAAPPCPAAARPISTTGWPPGPVRAASASS